MNIDKILIINMKLVTTFTMRKIEAYLQVNQF